MLSLFRNKKGKVLFFIILLFLLIALLIAFVSAGWFEDLFGGEESESVLWKRTPTTEIWKNSDGTYTTVLHSGVRFVDDESRRFPIYNLKIEDAESLKDKGVWDIIYLSNDSVHIIDVVDFNYSSITLNFSYDENSPNFSEYEYEVEEGKTKIKMKIIRINEDGEEYEEEIEIEIEEDDKYEFTLNEIPLGKKFQLGEGSTTVTLQDADTENLMDSYVHYEDKFDSGYNENEGTATSLSVHNTSDLDNEDVNSTSHAYLKFNLSSLISGDVGSIISASLSLYLYFGDPNLNISIYQVYDWKNGTGNNLLNETTITWNNQPCGANFTNDTNCNLTIESSTLTCINDCWQSWNVIHAMSDSVSKGFTNISFVLREIGDYGGHATDDYPIYRSKEHTTISTRPKLTITYTPHINIITPTPAQIFTEDQPTTYFNISTTVNMTDCYWSPNSGVTNYSLTNVTNWKNWTLANNSMVDGSYINTVFYCNQSSDGTWRTSDTVSFDVDSVNVTVCRDLTVAGREYELISNLTKSSVGGSCLSIKNENITFDGNNKNITVEDGISGGISNKGYKNSTLKNLLIDGVFLIGVVLDSGSDNLTLIDSILESRQVGAEYIDVTNSLGIKVINVSSSEVELVDATSDLTRKWYFQTEVNDTGGNSIQDANVTINNVTGNWVYSELTDATGNIGKEELIEYVNDGGTKIYHTPHTINVSKIRYYMNSTIYNLTTEQNVYHYLTLLGVTTYNRTITQSFSLNDLINRYRILTRTIFQSITIFRPLNRTYNFLGTSTSTAFNNTVTSEQPLSLTPVGETEMNYTKINASDDDYATDLNYTGHPYHKFNISIEESSINYVDVLWEGHTSIGMIYLWVWNYTLNNWSLLSNGSGTTDFNLTARIYDLENVRNGGSINFLVQD